MGLLDVIRPDDPRRQPGAYLTDGEKLVEVIEARHADVLAEDCRDGARWSIYHARLRDRWRLVRAAPGVPDLIPETED